MYEVLCTIPDYLLRFAGAKRKSERARLADRLTASADAPLVLQYSLNLSYNDR